ncbi:MAG: 50S ribosomal protein L25 [Patescibacteria group bacterium]
MLSLEVKPRKIGGNLYKIRDEGLMPAVFYGKKEKSTPVSVPLADFLKVWKKAGKSSIVILKSEKGDVEALIQEVDLDPITEQPRHADFYVFEKGHKIKVDVPLEFVGTSPAVKDLGGILIRVLHKLKIEAMPKDLPPKVEVDISSLVNFESQIVAGGLIMPAGVTLVEGAAEVIALVAEPKEEKEEEVAPVDLSAIEVEKKGKKEEEGAEGATPAKGEKNEKTAAEAPKAEKAEKSEKK